MRRYCSIIILLLLPIAMLTSQDIGTRIPYPENPIFGQSKEGPKAYYPCVLQDEDQFSGHGSAAKYKMWYGTSGGQVGLAYSDDGISWVDQGLVSENIRYHCKVLYDSNGFGNSGFYYRIWYANPTVWPYTHAVIRCAESVDGVNWVNDQAITQDEDKPLVTGECGWWYGSYGPGAVLYNPDGYETWHDHDPMGHQYVMYYDVAPMNCVPGNVEATALAYSLDGRHWKRYGDEPVLISGPDDAWDAGYTYAWTVLQKGNRYQLWYSGGADAAHEGLGYARSPNGIDWTRDPDNPIFHVADGVAWRTIRCYTPCVIKDGNTYKMWFSGRDSSGNTSVGYATWPIYSETISYIQDIPIPNFKRPGFLRKRLFLMYFNISDYYYQNNNPHIAAAILKGPVLRHLTPHGNGLNSWITDEAARLELIDQTSQLIAALGIDPEANFDKHSVPKIVNATPLDFNLEQNYPNPFNPATTIRYQLPAAKHVTIYIYNIKGQLLTTLVNEPKNAGEHTLIWNARDFPSGVYYYQIIAGEFSATRKCLLIK